jgi:hypothetical protein
MRKVNDTIIGIVVGIPFRATDDQVVLIFRINFHLKPVQKCALWGRDGDVPFHNQMSSHWVRRTLGSDETQTREEDNSY